MVSLIVDGGLCGFASWFPYEDLLGFSTKALLAASARVVPALYTRHSWSPERQALPDCGDVCFADGTSGQVDMRRFPGTPCICGTAFEPLVDGRLSAKVRLDLGAVA